MPQQQYPPFSSDTGGSMNPRQLNRWIDKSPQGGPLKRTQGYVPLPTFDQAVTWRDTVRLLWHSISPVQTTLSYLS